MNVEILDCIKHLLTNSFYIVLFHPDECKRPQISEHRELSIQILSWILGIIKGKALELIESFQSLVNDLCQSPRKESPTVDAAVLDEKVGSSVLLSIVILLIVIMARS